MEILFDVGVPWPLSQHFGPHHVTTAQRMGWGGLSNGELLGEAEKLFDVLITNDSNIEYQQRLPDYNIAVIILRAERSDADLYAALVPECLSLLETIQPGEVVYLYTDKMKEIMARRGRE
jgi:hypothetical protein